VRAETCSDVACVIYEYTRKEVVAKEAIITVFICDSVFVRRELKSSYWKSRLTHWALSL
jgi:hypothetical protein